MNAAGVACFVLYLFASLRAAFLIVSFFEVVLNILLEGRTTFQLISKNTSQKDTTKNTTHYKSNRHNAKQATLAALRNAPQYIQNEHVYSSQRYPYTMHTRC